MQDFREMRRGLNLLLIVGGAAALTMDSVSMRKIDLGGGRAMSVAEPKENVAAADAAVAEILGIAVDAIKAQRKALASYDNAEGQKLWPASVAFARMLTGSMVPSVKGLRVIELGAGLGVVGVAAAIAGAEKVTLTDFQPKSLELAEITAKANGVSSAIFSTRLLDWNHPGDLASLGPYDLVVASDVLYDKALTRVLVRDVIAPLLLSPPRDRTRPEPRAMLVDPPLRPSRSLLPEICAECGLYWGGEAPVAEAKEGDTVVIYLLRG